MASSKVIRNSLPGKSEKNVSKFWVIEIQNTYKKGLKQNVNRFNFMKFSKIDYFLQWKIQQRPLQCVVGMTVNKFQILLCGGSQFLALSMVLKPFLPPTTAMMMQEAPPPRTRMCPRTLQDWDSLIVHPDKQTHFQAFLTFLTWFTCRTVDYIKNYVKLNSLVA